MTDAMLASLLETNETLRLDRLAREEREALGLRMTRAELAEYQKDFDEERESGWSAQ